MTPADRMLTRDFLGGVMFAAFGIATTWISFSYDIGTATRMGPGYFPAMVGGLIVLLGTVLAIRAYILATPEDRAVKLAFRPMVFILAAIGAFMMLVDTWGLVAAVAALILIARLSRFEGRYLELVATVVLLNAIAVAVFVFGLNMPLDLGPR